MMFFLSKNCCITLLNIIISLFAYKSNYSGFLVNGQIPLYEFDDDIDDTEEEDFHSYLVSIHYDTGKKIKHICSGTIISNSWILTAAHCVYKPFSTKPLSPQKFHIISGVGNLENVNISSKKYSFEVDKIVAHPLYDLKRPINDVALIFLYGRIPMQDYGSINLASQNILDFDYYSPVQDYQDNQDFQDYVNTDNDEDEFEYFEHDPELKNCVALGWSNKKINKISMKIIKSDVCRKRGHNVGDEQICAFFNEDDGIFDDICQEESGGPLICDGDQVGVASFDLACGMKNTPSIFGRIENYKLWIKEVTGIELDETEDYDDDADDVDDVFDDDLQEYKELDTFSYRKGRGGPTTKFTPGGPWIKPTTKPWKPSGPWVIPTTKPSPPRPGAPGQNPPGRPPGRPPGGRPGYPGYVHPGGVNRPGGSSGGNRFTGSKPTYVYSPVVYGKRPGGIAYYHRIGTYAYRYHYRQPYGGYRYYGIYYKSIEGFPMDVYLGRPILFYLRPWFMLGYYMSHMYYWNDEFKDHSVYGYGYRGYSYSRRRADPEDKNKPPTTPAPAFVLSYCKYKSTTTTTTATPTPAAAAAAATTTTTASPENTGETTTTSPTAETEPSVPPMMRRVARAVVDEGDFEFFYRERCKDQDPAFYTDPSQTVEDMCETSLTFCSSTKALNQETKVYFVILVLLVTYVFS